MPIFIEKIFNFSFFRIILDRNAQHDIELAKFQQTIKEQALTILNVNKELKSCQQQIESMPIKDAMTFMVCLAFMVRASQDVTFTLDDAWRLPLGEVLSAVNLAEHG